MPIALREGPFGKAGERILSPQDKPDVVLVIGSHGRCHCIEYPPCFVGIVAHAVVAMAERPLRNEAASLQQGSRIPVLLGPPLREISPKGGALCAARSLAIMRGFPI